MSASFNKARIFLIWLAFVPTLLAKSSDVTVLLVSAIYVKMWSAIENFVSIFTSFLKIIFYYIVYLYLIQVQVWFLLIIRLI